MARGFTLLEVLFVIAVAAILLSVGVPSFQTTIRNARLTSSVNELIASMQLARSEAIKRRVPVVMCTSGGGDNCDGSAAWEEGWIVWHDDNADGARDAASELLLQRRDTMRRGIRVSTPGQQPMQNQLVYSPTGFPAVGGLEAARMMVICDNQNSDYFGRVIVVAQTGRPVGNRIDAHDFGTTVTCE